MAKQGGGWLSKRDGWLSKGNWWLVGSAPACHGKLSGFESRHPLEIIMDDKGKGVASTLQPAKNIHKKDSSMSSDAYCRTLP